MTRTGNRRLTYGVIGAARLGQTVPVALGCHAVASLRHKPRITRQSSTIEGMPSSSIRVRLLLCLVASFACRTVVGAPITWYWDGPANTPAATLAAITASMDEAIDYYNAYSEYEWQEYSNDPRGIRVIYDPAVPTANAIYRSRISFGGSTGVQVAMHEMSHVLGVGTFEPVWTNRLESGQWTGAVANALVEEFDGPGTTIYGDASHFWPYGLNFSSEDSLENRRRHVLMVGALRADMRLRSGNATGLRGDYNNDGRRRRGRLLRLARPQRRHHIAGQRRFHRQRRRQRLRLVGPGLRPVGRRHGVRGRAGATRLDRRATRCRDPALPRQGRAARLRIAPAWMIGLRSSTWGVSACLNACASERRTRVTSLQRSSIRRQTSSLSTARPAVDNSVVGRVERATSTD